MCSWTRPSLVAVACLLFSMPALAEEPDPEESLTIDEIEVRGTVQRPGAIYLLPRAKIDHDRLGRDARHRILSRWKGESPKVVETRLEDGSRTRTGYREDGTREWLTELNTRGFQNGKTTRWHPNGEVRVVEHWVHGRKAGTWTYLAEDGTPQTRLVFDEKQNRTRWTYVQGEWSPEIRADPPAPASR